MKAGPACHADRFGWLFKFGSAALVLCATATHAQFSPTDTLSARSMSGQFTVYAPRLDDASALPQAMATNVNYVELAPTLLTVSAERIRQSLCRELDAPQTWRGKIHLTIHPVIAEDEEVTVVTERFPNNWNYRVDLPQLVERQRFVRALVQVILLEMANRNAGNRSAEIPAWLAEGLTQHLLSSREIELILPPPRLNLNGLTISPAIIQARKLDPLNEARKTLRERPPLTLKELSWPTNEQLYGEAGDSFRRSAQVFVTELLRLRGGRECFRAMLNELASCYNWQTAFFKAFEAHFSRQLDLEKWWALQAVNFAGRDPGQLATIDESAGMLDEALRMTVDVRHSVDELPTRAEVTLQSIIREWDFLRQQSTLQKKLREMELVRMRMAPEFIPLLDAYHQVITNYLQRRQRPDLILATAKSIAPTAKSIAREAIRQLDELDAKRQSLRPKQDSPTSPVEAQKVATTP